MGDLHKYLKYRSKSKIFAESKSRSNFCLQLQIEIYFFGNCPVFGSIWIQFHVQATSNQIEILNSMIFKMY